ncbi:MAG: hypothetical protein ABIP14_11920 [Blastocatellia bacterium]
MKLKITSSLFVVMLVAAGFCFAGGKPDFSGTWKLEKDRSFSNPPGLEQTLVITQKGNQVTLDTDLKTTRGGPQKLIEVYSLDGKEGDFTPAQPPNAKGKRKASWLPNGQGVMIEDVVSVDGKVISQTTRKWTLSADGKTLTVDYFIDVQHASYEAKRVFTKAG